MVGVLVSRPISGGSFQLLTTECDVSCGPILHGPYYVEVPSLSLLRVLFIIKRMPKFVKYLFCPYGDDHGVFILHFVYALNHVVDLYHPCIPGINPA